MPTNDWAPNLGSALFAVRRDVLPRWRDMLGLVVAGPLRVREARTSGQDHGVRVEPNVASVLPRNVMALRLLDRYGVQRTGLGMILDEALEPAYVEVAGLKVQEASSSFSSASGRPRRSTTGADRARLTVIASPAAVGGREQRPSEGGAQELHREAQDDHPAEDPGGGLERE